MSEGSLIHLLSPLGIIITRTYYNMQSITNIYLDKNKYGKLLKNVFNSQIVNKIIFNTS